MGEIQ